MIKSLETTLEESFLDYSAYVIQRRAIPDARDMLKYTARQILHAQFRAKLDCAHPFKKSQKSVSEATSFSYVHGDTSCYEQIIRMGRPLVQRYFFEEIEGNGGTPIKSGDYSAPRYTEARLSPLGTHIFEGIKKKTIIAGDWEPTYDEEGEFPRVLPSKGYYNICNGAFGSIAPTMISSVPQFNLREVNKVIVDLLRNPEAQFTLLPDFASGGILVNPRTTAASLQKGQGRSALLRGRVVKNPKKGVLMIQELPYGVYTNTVCLELEEALSEGRPPFTKFKDFSKRTVDIHIWSKDLDELERWLYKNTSVQKHFTIRLTMLDGGKVPRLFSLREALLGHIEHAKSVLRNELTYDIEVLEARLHIIEGLLKAYSILDEVIALIKSSSGRKDAILQLGARFQFTIPQAEAIVDLRLHNLSKIDVQTLGKEKDDLKAKLAETQGVLNNEARFTDALVAQYESVAKKFGDGRRTQIAEQEDLEYPDEIAEVAKVVFTSMGIQASTEESADGEWCGQEQSILLVSNLTRMWRKSPSGLASNGETPYADFVKLQPKEKIVYACILSPGEHPKLMFEAAKTKRRVLLDSRSATVRGKLALAKMELGSFLGVSK